MGVSVIAAMVAGVIACRQPAPPLPPPSSVERAEDTSTQRADAETTQNEIIKRLREFAREALKALPAEQRDARLVEWLDDPLDVMKLATMGIVSRRIADEGKRPEGEVLASLLRLLPHDSPVVRREALLIVQNLNDPWVVEGVLARVGEEKDQAIRQVALQSLGKIGSASAIPALVREIESTTSNTDCVREAASALSVLAGAPEAKRVLIEAAVPLLARYQATPGSATALRAALLSAIAGVADASFAAEFVDAIESDDVGVLQAGLRGLRGLGDASRLPRCRVLTGHADARVRLAAVEAVASLGCDDADIEALLVRVDPVVETSELPREAAWRGFKLLTSKLPISERMRVIDRLRGTPDFAVKYMEELAASLSAGPNHVAELDALRDRLSAALVNLGRDAEAAPHLREMYTVRASRGDPSAAAVGLRWLNAVLNSPTSSGLGELVSRLLATTSDPARQTEIFQAIQGTFESPALTADAERSRRFLTELRSVSAEPLSGEWTQLLQRLSSEVESRNKQAESKPSP